jgi:hypothetical protein
MKNADSLRPGHCPRFDRCSAPLCPLDQFRHLRSYLKGEPTCLYLREWAKAGACGAWTGTLPPAMVAGIAEVAPGLLAAPGPHSARLRRAKGAGSKVAAGQRLQRGDSVRVRSHVAPA